MVTIAFPASPNPGDVYSFGGRSWQWNGYGWQVYPSSFTSGLTINATTITGGTSGRILYDNAATVGELVTGTGVATAIGNNTNSANGLAVLNGSGVLAIANGGTNNSSAYTAGSVIFSDGTSLTQDNPNFFWDDTNNRLGIGTATPSNRLTIVGGDALIQGATFGVGGGGLSNNVAVGIGALAATATGGNNIGIGNGAMASVLGGNTNVAVGTQALNKTTAGVRHVAIGYQALYNDLSNLGCVALGFQALASNTSDQAVAVGYQALLSNTTGYANTAVGANALRINTSGQQSTAVGFGALYTNNANYNVGIGTNALYFNSSGQSNIAVGWQALYANTASNNTGIGNAALSANTSGATNTGIGYNALYLNQTGSNNTSVGSASLYSTTGSQNTSIGSLAGLNLTSGSNCTIIGYNAQPSSATATNEITLGNSSVTVLRCQQTTITSLSDARDKDDIADLDIGMDLIKELRPVSFTWNMRDGGIVGAPDIGFIAQELAQAQENLGVIIPGLVYDTNPEAIEASYGKLLPVIVKALQELKSEFDAYKNTHP